MITKLRAKNFQGIESAELDLAPITAVYGSNAAGKSSLADALLHALTGDALRGGTLADVVRQGYKAAEVEVLVDGTLSISRRRTKSGGEAYLNGVETKAVEVEAAVRKALGGVGPGTLRATLQAGNVLDLEPQKLQQLLSSLTGAKLDEAAIRGAFEASVVEAAKRTGLSLPGALDAFDACEKRAEGARQSAKRTLRECEVDLERTPAAGLREAVTHDQVVDRLNDLGKRRDKARHDVAKGAGAREERLQSLQARLAKLGMVERPAKDGAGAPDVAKKLAEVEATAKAIAAEVAATEARLEEANRGAAGGGDDAALLAQEETLKASLAALHTERTAARDALATVEEAGKRLRSMLDRIPKGGTVGECPVLPETVCPLTDLSGLLAKLSKAREEAAKKFRAAEARQTAAEENLLDATDRLEQVAQAKVREASRKRAAELTSRCHDLQRQATEAEDTLRSLRAYSAELQAELAAYLSWQSIEQERASLQTAVAEVEKAPVVQAEDVAVLDAEIALSQAALQALDQGARRARAEKAVAAATKTVEDTDLVAKACGPAGVKAALLARAVAPFVATANAALHELAHGYSVIISDTFELLVRTSGRTLRPAQLSDGERTRLVYVLQLAVADLSGIKLLVLDRGELLDAEGKASLKRLLGAAVAAGIQVLMLSCATPPAVSQPGMAIFVMENGRSRQVTAAAA